VIGFDDFTFLSLSILGGEPVQNMCDVDGISLPDQGFHMGSQWGKFGISG
jgi:hypothetical protein